MRLAVILAVIATMGLIGCGPPGWESMSKPDLVEKDAMLAVESFVGTNGWEMCESAAFEFSYGKKQPPLLQGLPWSRLKNRCYPALTSGGILYVELTGFHHDIIGVAYNPNANRFPKEVGGFKPLADHWYVWTTAEDRAGNLNLTQRYEDER